MPEDGLQFFQFQKWGHPEHALAVKASVRDQDMTVGVESEKIAEGLNGDHGARDRILFVYDLLQENLQGFPGAAAQVMEQTTIIEKVPAQDFRNAEDKMTVGNLFQHMCT
jgi:hypothetical protein